MSNLPVQTRFEGQPRPFLVRILSFFEFILILLSFIFIFIDKLSISDAQKNI